MNTIPFNVLDFIILFGGALSILMSIAQVIRPNKKFGNWYFCVVFLATGLFLFYFYFHISIRDFDYTYRYAPIMFILMFATIPIHYASGYKILVREITIDRKDLAHFTPAAVAFIIAVLNETGIITCRSALPWIPTPSINIVHYVLIIAWLILFLIYEIILVAQFFLQLRHSAFNRNLYPVIFSILFFILIVILLMISQILYLFEMTKITMSLISLIIVIWYLFTYLFPDMYPSLNAAIGRYELVHTKRIDRDSIRSQLMDLIQDEKVFCDEDLTLQRLASMLSMTPHQLSEFLNRELNRNFSSFINFHRIEEAKHLLVSDPERSIISIALAVGFNSKSVFYNAFMKYAGKSPLKYRKDNL